jgi:hypothetical protein
MRYKQSIFCFLLILNSAAICSAKEWRGIVPLHSTRADVERLLGPLPKDLPIYYLPNETVYVNFAEQPCDGRDNTKWNVPLGTVTGIWVKPKSLVKIEDLNLNISKFEKVPGPSDTYGLFYYVDREEGFSVGISNGLVTEYTYVGTAKDAYLRCPGPPRSFLQCNQLKVKISYPTSPTVAGNPVTISASVKTDDPNFLPQTFYYWYVYDGVKVVSGQGTPELVIDTSGLEGKTVVVSLYLRGTPEICQHSIEFKVINANLKQGRLKKNRYSNRRLRRLK